MIDEYFLDEGKTPKISPVRSNSNIIMKKASHLRLNEAAITGVFDHEIPLGEVTSNGIQDGSNLVRKRARDGSIISTTSGTSKTSRFKLSYLPKVPTYVINNIMDTNPQELDEETEMLVKKRGITCMLLTTVAAISLSSFQYGWAIGVVNAPAKIVTAWYNQTYYERNGVPMSESKITMLWAITVSIYNISGLFGGLSSSYFSDKFGRKKTLLINNSLTFVAAILFLTARSARSYEMVIIARFVIGFNCGITSSTVSVYISEVSPVNLRGAMCSSHQVFLSFGILLSQVIGLGQALGNENGWPILFALAVVPAILQMCILPLVPESPRYLLIYRGKEKSAHKALVRLRNDPDIDDEINQMKVEFEDSRRLPKVTWADMINKPVYRKPLIIASETHISQQLSGISAVMSYSTILFLRANLTQESAIHATIANGVLYFLLCGLSSLVVERAGRRTLYLTGLGGMWFSSIFLTVMLVLGDEKGYQWASYTAILFVYTYVGFCAIGPSVIAWFIASELFTQSARPKGAALSVCFNWISSFIAVLLFPILLVSLKNYVFLVFTVLLALFWLYTYYFLPETQGRTSDELSRLFMTPKEKSAIYKFWKNYNFLRNKQQNHAHRHNHNYQTKF